MSTIREELDSQIAAEQATIAASTAKIEKLTAEKAIYDSEQLLDKESTWFQRLMEALNYIKA